MGSKRVRLGPQLSKNEHFGGNEPRLGEEMGILGTKLRLRGCNPPFWGSKEPFQHRGKTPKQRIHGQKGALRALLWCSGAKNGFCGVKGPFFSTKSIIWENKAPTSILRGGIRPPSPKPPHFGAPEAPPFGSPRAVLAPAAKLPRFEAEISHFEGQIPHFGAVPQRRAPIHSRNPQIRAPRRRFGVKNIILGAESSSGRCWVSCCANQCLSLKPRLGAKLLIEGHKHPSVGGKKPKGPRWGWEGASGGRKGRLGANPRIAGR